MPESDVLIVLEFEMDEWYNSRESLNVTRQQIAWYYYLILDFRYLLPGKSESYLCETLFGYFPLELPKAGH